MTLGGLMCMLLPTMALASFCYDFQVSARSSSLRTCFQDKGDLIRADAPVQSTAPAWVYLANAVGIFIYQVRHDNDICLVQ